MKSGAKMFVVASDVVQGQVSKGFESVREALTHTCSQRLELNMTAALFK